TVVVAEGDRFHFTVPHRVNKRIQTCFKKADFRPLLVKILANTAVLAVFCALIEQKSALFEICDLKANRFRGIFARFRCSKAAALQG
ncbi:MAG: hypothetical protein IJN82_02015, partial [Clostridia bacterium]|nr:hypothetical protein [Clostridia bacterium]